MRRAFLTIALIAPLGLGCGTGKPAEVVDTVDTADADTTQAVDVDAVSMGSDVVDDSGVDPVADATGDTFADTAVEPDVEPDVLSVTDAWDSTDSSSDGWIVEDVDGSSSDTSEEPTQSPLAGAVVFNEVLIDADTDTLLDPNGDGDLNSVDDEFVEIVNVSAAAVDLSGFTIVEEDFPISPRHVFAAGAGLNPGQAVVVFGGGEAPEPITGAWFVVAYNTDPGFSFGLHLTDEGNHLRLLDSDGLPVTELAYGSAGGPPVPEDQSLTRWPDGSGEWSPHSEAAPGAEIFSPGTQIDGAAFVGP